MIILNIGDETTAAANRHPFDQQGIDPSHLVFEKRLPFEDYLARHNTVDLGLDSFPYNGSTTTYMAAWMGAPQVTWRGERLCSRLGAEIMLHLGLDELVATTAEEYVERAVALAIDLDRLERLRASLRPRIAASPPGPTRPPIPAPWKSSTGARGRNASGRWPK